jgi:hypothetical protein
LKPSMMLLDRRRERHLIVCSSTGRDGSKKQPAGLYPED